MNAQKVKFAIYFWTLTVPILITVVLCRSFYLIADALRWSSMADAWIDTARSIKDWRDHKLTAYIKKHSLKHLFI